MLSFSFINVIFACDECFFLLFQTGNESSVDRLMKQISSFMSEISDEFKIVVVEAIRSVNKTNTEHFVSCHHCNNGSIKGTKSNVIRDNLHRPVIF